MDYIKRFFIFLYDFLIGEDWLGAIIVLVGFGATYFVAHAGVTAYWIGLLSVAISLAVSVGRKLNAER